MLTSNAMIQKQIYFKSSVLTTTKQPHLKFGKTSFNVLRTKKLSGAYISKSTPNQVDQTCEVPPPHPDLIQVGSGVHTLITDKEVNDGNYYWGRSAIKDSLLNQ